MNMMMMYFLLLSTKSVQPAISTIYICVLRTEKELFISHHGWDLNNSFSEEGWKTCVLNIVDITDQ